MKIVSISDVHMATRNLARMSEVWRDTDLAIIAGDLTNFGGVEDARKVLDDVRACCKNVLAVPGNLDQPETFPYFEREGIALHGKGMVIEGVGLFGCGGSSITPFKTPSEFTEDEIYAALAQGYEAVREVRPLIMVCHTPPLGDEVRSHRERQGGWLSRPRATSSRSISPRYASRGTSTNRRPSTRSGARWCLMRDHSRAAATSS